MTPEGGTPSDAGVSEGAVATPTRVDNLAEKIFNAVTPAIENEDPMDVLAALSFVSQRFQHVVNTKIDASQITQ